MPRFTDTACRDAAGPWVKGDSAYTTSDDRLWIYNGSAWDLVSAKMVAQLWMNNATYTPPVAYQNSLVPMAIQSQTPAGWLSANAGTFTVSQAGLYHIQVYLHVIEPATGVQSVQASIGVGAIGTIRARGTALILRGGDGLVTQNAQVAMTTYLTPSTGFSVRAFASTTTAVIGIQGTGYIHFLGRGV